MLNTKIGARREFLDAVINIYIQENFKIQILRTMYLKKFFLTNSSFHLKYIEEEYDRTKLNLDG